MPRLVQHCLLLFALLVIHVGSASAAMEQFKEWYPEWGFIFARIMKENCQEEYQYYLNSSIPATGLYDKAFWLGAGPWSAGVVPLVNCIVDNSSEYQKSGMASANVVLGLTPAILAALGSTVDETSLIYIFGRRPFLALCLSAGSPGLPPRPLFEYRKFDQLQEKRPGRLRFRSFPFLVEVLIWAVEHLVAFASIFNVATLGYQLGSRVIMVFAPELTYLILLWLFLGTIGHILAALTLLLRVRIKNPDISDSGTWLKSWITPGTAGGYTKFTILNEGFVYAAFSGLLSLLIAAHIIFGTLVFSSVLFISVRDCMPVVGRLMASVIACRMVLMYELARLRHFCQKRKGKPPIYIIEHQQEENEDGSAEEFGDSMQLSDFTLSRTDSSQPLLPHNNQDYVVTQYVAEFINTLSSLAYSSFTSHPRRASRRRKLTPSSCLRTPRVAPLPQIPNRLALVLVLRFNGRWHLFWRIPYDSEVPHSNVYAPLPASIVILFLTVLSLSVDELSMHLLTTPLLYRLLTFKASPWHTKLTGVVLLSLFTIVMVTHIVMDEFILHAITFASGVLFIAHRTLNIISNHVPDPHIRRSLRNISILGCWCFSFGYSLWLIDEWACRYLTDTRYAVGLPFAFLLELHGWWHIFTALGGYIAVAIVDLTTSGEVIKDPTKHLAWPIPFVARCMANSARLVKTKVV
ncbi:hypothetical protein NM208_g1314 [Fusarium decemcellulare]|uniref:Uncharacterized protein n=1 Tax=Fusarium decemcellulare TaxID=57161 RepID=A0ACC1SWP4_9HYPO|nr:hypothetical protein NM208_g1314 [Fusarium decemcellulare]